MSYKIDLHIHTDYSDGSMSPTEIVKRFKGLDYDMIAITDHDGVGGVAEAMIAAEALDFKVIPGIEFATFVDRNILERAGIKQSFMEMQNIGTGTGTVSASASGIPSGSLSVSSHSSSGDRACDEITVPIGHRTEAHLLGYHIDVENEALALGLADIREKRKERNLALVEALAGMGLDISYEELSNRKKKGYIGKPDIARLLVEKGYAKSVREALDRTDLLGSKEAVACPKHMIPISKAMELVKGAGGITVLAHPMKIKKIGERGSEEFFENLDKLLRELKKLGLKGLECYHKSHSEEEALKLVGFAEKYHLHITEGSDFHGEDF